MPSKLVVEAKVNSKRRGNTQEEVQLSSIFNPERTTTLSTHFYVIGSSTGGPDLLREIFQSIHSNIPGCVVAQHMPALFTKKFCRTIKYCQQADY